MSIQLPLPGVWPRNMTWHDPNAELERLARDKLDAKAEIYATMKRLADRHGISLLQVNGVMLDYIDDALGDLTFLREQDLERDRKEMLEIR